MVQTMEWLAVIWVAVSIPVALFLGALARDGRPVTPLLDLVDNSDATGATSYRDARPRLSTPSVPLSANVRIFASRSTTGPDA
jgi:hypothetical protein